MDPESGRPVTELTHGPYGCGTTEVVELTSASEADQSPPHGCGTAEVMELTSASETKPASKASAPKAPASKLEKMVGVVSPPKATEPEQPEVAPQGDKKKIPVPQKPEKFFKKVVLPKLEQGGPVDITGYLVEWAPERLKVIKRAMRDPSHEAIRVEAKSVMASYDDLTVQCLAEYRSKEGVRIMMKVKAPNGKVSQAGSHLSDRRGGLLLEVCLSLH